MRHPGRGLSADPACAVERVLSSVPFRRFACVHTTVTMSKIVMQTPHSTHATRPSIYPSIYIRRVCVYMSMSMYSECKPVKHSDSVWVRSGSAADGPLCAHGRRPTAAAATPMAHAMAGPRQTALHHSAHRPDGRNAWPWVFPAPTPPPASMPIACRPLTSLRRLEPCCVHRPQSVHAVQRPASVEVASL